MSALTENTDYTSTDYGVTDPIVQEMLDFVRMSEDANKDNAERFVKATKFAIGGKHQWEDKVLTARDEDNMPSESFNQIPQFTNQVVNDMRMNMPQIRFIAGKDTDEEKAGILEDLVRAIQVSGDADTAYDAAADNQVTGGWGYWRYVTEYESEDTFDQIIKPRWVPNPLTILDDPFCTMQDRSDRKKLVEFSDEPLKQFNRDYDRDYDSTRLETMGAAMPNWANTTRGSESVRVAEFWKIKEKTKYLTRDGKQHDEQPKGVATNNWRKITLSTVMWYKCTAHEKLEEQEWAGKYIPYVFLPGIMKNIEGKIRFSGLVEPMMPVQFQYNYWMNTAIMMAGLSMRNPYLVAAGQIDGKLQKMWDNANRKNYPFLVYNPIDVKGNPVGAPARASTSYDSSNAAAMVQAAQQMFYNVTGIYPASLGQASNEKSGKAILARQREGDVSTFIFPDNMAKAQNFGGVILKDLIPRIYDGARAIRLVREDKSTYEVDINREFTDEKGKKKHYDLTTGTYEVSVTTGPSYTTRRQEAADAQMQMLQTPLGQIVAQTSADVIIRNQDWPGSEEMAERIKRSMPPQITEDPDEDAQPIPPQVKMALETAAQQIEQLNAALQGAGQELQAAQADNAAKMADVQNKQADLQLKAQQMELSAAEAQRKAELDMVKLQLDNRKLDLDEQKIMLERDKAEFDALQQQMQAMQPQAPSGGGDMSLMATDKLRQQLMQAEERDAQASIAAESEQAQMMAERAEKQLREDTRDQMMNALLERLAELQATIAAPKMVLRDANGDIAGVAVQ